MKKLLLPIFLICLVNFSLTAQDINKENVNSTQSKVFQQEAGILFNSISDAVALRNFGLVYRVGNSSSMWRFNALNLSYGNVQTNNPDRTTTNNRFSMTLKVGKEFRKPISKNLELRYGADLSFGYTKIKSVDEININELKETRIINELRPGVNAVLGVNYVFNNKFIIGAELLPTIEYSINENYNPQDKENTLRSTNGYNMYINNGLMHLSCAIRF